MKKCMTIAAAALLLLSATAFATEVDGTVTAKVKAAFVKNFSGATDVSWQNTGGLYYATFTINNSKTDAAFNEQGDLVTTSRKISREQMPLAVTVALNEKYAGYTFDCNATEVSCQNETCYYISISNDKQSLYLKVMSNGAISIEDKTKK